ncbi:peptidylprolyl isomerase [bacterium]|nr:peptidylprolyl isomerase [bacterium]
MEKEKTLVEIVLSNNDTIRLELYPDIAPITVNNFLSLVDNKFYDGTIFHRVIANFMIQTGGYFIRDNAIYEKEAKEIKGEFLSNGIKNDIKHVPGVISMARTYIKDSASSQFFICVNTCPHLDNEYAAFGKTVDNESLENAIKISKVKTGRFERYFDDFPVEPIIIKTIRRI